MKKLELNHLAPYLPYGLKTVKGVTRIEITSVSLELPHIYHTSYLGSRLRVVSKIEEIKPILRPLSDLTKEIEHNGEKLIPLYKIIKEDKAFTIDFIHAFGYEELKVSVYELLLEYHFDIFGMIEKGLAIDINTLNERI